MAAISDQWLMNASHLCHSPEASHPSEMTSQPRAKASCAQAARAEKEKVATLDTFT
jgi:hypothetical protein